ncbi:MAG: ABC transporter permease [Caldilineaceae bacterium]
MLDFILRRILLAIPTLVMVSIVSYAIIELPPGDYLTSYIAYSWSSRDRVSQSELAALQQRYGLISRYTFATGSGSAALCRATWVCRSTGIALSRILSSSGYGLTALISLLSTLFIWVVALPIGIYSATRQYSVGDYFFTFVGFIGVGIPDFLLALVILWWAWSTFGVNLGGLYGPEFIGEPWNWPKIMEVLKRIWVPMVIIGTAGRRA